MKTDHKEGIINQMVDIAPFEVNPRLIPYIKECMDIAVQRRDEKIKEWAEMKIKAMEPYHLLDDGFVRGRIGLKDSLLQFLSASSPSVEPSLPKELDQPEMVSDNFRINIIPELSRKELEERCIEMYEKIEAMKWNFANKEDDYGMEIKRLTDQPSILEEVKRLRDEHEKIFNTPSSETLSLECELRYDFIKELTQIINKHE